MEKQLTLEDIQNFEGKYPKQLWYLFLVEMWERFCFYGMRGVLTIFMADKMLGLSFSDKEANLKYGAIQAFVYAFTFIGGIFADKVLGYKKSLTFGAIVMILRRKIYSTLAFHYPSSVPDSSNRTFHPLLEIYIRKVIQDEMQDSAYSIRASISVPC